MFTTSRLLLCVIGFSSDPAIHRRSLGISLTSGAVVLAAGLVLLFLGRRK